MPELKAESLKTGEPVRSKYLSFFRQYGISDGLYYSVFILASINFKSS